MAKDTQPVEIVAGSAKIGKVQIINAADTKTPEIGNFPMANDGQTSIDVLYSAVFPQQFNGTSWDRQRNNTTGTLLASAARTATTDSPDQTNYNARGVQIILRVSPASGTGGLTLRIYGKDSVSGLYYTLNLAPTAITASGTYVYELYPGASGTEIVQKTSGILARTWKVQVVAGDASSYTYSVGYSLIL